MILSVSAAAVAQPILTPDNLPLGGGGTAYLTGFEANFYNPANLMIKERHSNLEIGILQSAFYFEPVLSASPFSAQFNNFSDIFSIHKNGSQNLQSGDRENLLDRNFGETDLISEHQNRADIILAGASWQRENSTYSIAARMRTATRTEVGRGWYSGLFIDSDNQEVRDLTLNQQSNTLFELSFGYAREFMPLSGLFSQLSKLYVGIAPKVVMAGSFFDVRSFSEYQETSGSMPRLIQSFEYYSSGQLSSMTSQYLIAGDASDAISRSLDNRFFTDPTGWGAGIDFGLTYILTLGGDLPTFQLQGGRAPVEKSLRISLSITDIGFVRYNKQPLSIQNGRDTTLTAAIDPADSKFVGAFGQHLAFLSSTSSSFDPYLNSELVRQSEFSILLPTSFNAGLLFEINRVKLMADLTLGITESAFGNGKLTAHLGLELRPLSSMPVRVGTQITDERASYIGLGIGYEHRRFEINLATGLSTQTSGNALQPVGGAFGGLKLYF